MLTGGTDEWGYTAFQHAEPSRHEEGPACGYSRSQSPCMVKAEALLTFPQAGRPPDRSGHQRLFWLRLCTQGLLFALQPGKTKKHRGIIKNYAGTMWVQSLGWEYPLEEETATHSNICARIIS